MAGPQRGEGRKIAPGGARSLHCGRDDSKKARPRAALPVFFPGESRTSNGKCINSRHRLPACASLSAVLLFFCHPERFQGSTRSDSFCSAPGKSLRVDPSTTRQKNAAPVGMTKKTLSGQNVETSPGASRRPFGKLRAGSLPSSGEVISSGLFQFSSVHGPVVRAESQRLGGAFEVLEHQHSALDRHLSGARHDVFHVRVMHDQ